jgi:hypothetical protein
MGNVFEACSRLSSDIDNYSIEILAPDMVPECQFANSAKPVYTQPFTV